MGFEQFSLDQRVLSGIKSVGYTTPTPIQQQAIPIALEGRDLLGLAQRHSILLDKLVLSLR